MSDDVPTPRDTQEFPPYTKCPFYNRQKDDIDREFKEFIKDVLDNRELTIREEKIIKEVSNEMFDLMIANHKTKCRSEMSQSGRDWLSVIISVISVLIAFGMMVIMIYSKGSS